MAQYQYLEVTPTEQNLVSELNLVDGSIYRVQNLAEEPGDVIHFEERIASNARVGPGARIFPGQPPLEYEVIADTPAFVWCNPYRRAHLVVILDP